MVDTLDVTREIMVNVIVIVIIIIAAKANVNVVVVVDVVVDGVIGFVLLPLFLLLSLLLV